MDLLDRRAEEAIAVEEQSVLEQEIEEGTVLLEGPSNSLNLNLSSST